MLDPRRTQRYRRHDLIDWFSQEQVSAARVAVIGAGAVGNEVVKNLALLGCGTIDVFDFDVVELHNLTRSVLFREADVGRWKAEVVAARTAELERFYESELVPLAEQSVQAALLAFRANRVMVDEVIAARRVALETWLKHLRLVADRSQAQYDVDYLVGGAESEQ